MRSRGTLRLPVPGNELAGSAPHEVRRAECMVRTPLDSKSRRRGLSGVFRLRDGLASESIHYAQDDRVRKMEGKNQSIHYARDDSDKSRSESPDLEVFRAYIPGRRAPGRSPRSVREAGRCVTRSINVRKSCGDGNAAKSPALSQRTREGQGTRDLGVVKAWAGPCRRPEGLRGPLIIRTARPLPHVHRSLRSFPPRPAMVAAAGDEI